MNNPKLLHSKGESARMLSLSLRTVDGLIQRKQLAVIRVGKRVLVSDKSLREFAHQGQVVQEGYGGTDESRAVKKTKRTGRRQGDRALDEESNTPRQDGV